MGLTCILRIPIKFYKTKKQEDNASHSLMFISTQINFRHLDIYKKFYY